MRAYVSNWSALGYLLGKMLPAQYAGILPAVYDKTQQTPPNGREAGEVLVRFVVSLVKQDKIDQLDGLVECTGFNFIEFVCFETVGHTFLPLPEQVVEHRTDVARFADPAHREVLSHPMTFLFLWDEVDALHTIICRDHGRELPFTVWLCEQATKNPSGDMRDIYVAFALVFAVYTERPENVEHAVKALPPTPRSLSETLVRGMIMCGGGSYNTDEVRLLAEGFGLTDAEFLRGCRAPDVLKRHAECNNKEDGAWLLQRACSLSVEGEAWLLTAWLTPKSTHKKCFTAAVLRHLTDAIRSGETSAETESRIDDLITNLRRILPPGFKASESACITFVQKRWPFNGTHDTIDVAERLLDVLGFDLKAYVREEFQAVCVPTGHKETEARAKPFHPLNYVPAFGLPGRLLLAPKTHTEKILAWLKTFLAPGDLVYPDGFSSILPRLAVSHAPAENDTIYSFLKAMGYTTANERQHKYPAKRVYRSSHVGPNDLSSRIPEG